MRTERTKCHMNSWYSTKDIVSSTLKRLYDTDNLEEAKQKLTVTNIKFYAKTIKKIVDN